MARPDLGSASWTVRYGGSEAHGTARLSSLEPYRASNGGDERFTFLVTAHNGGSRMADFRLSTQDVPAECARRHAVLARDLAAEADGARR